MITIRIYVVPKSSVTVIEYELREGVQKYGVQWAIPWRLLDREGDGNAFHFGVEMCERRLVRYLRDRRKDRIVSTSGGQI